MIFLGIIGTYLGVIDTSLFATWFFDSGRDQTPLPVLFGVTVALLWVWLGFFVLAVRDR